MSKRRPPKKRGNQTDRLTSKINLAAAILGLATVVLALLQQLLE